MQCHTVNRKTRGIRFLNDHAPTIVWGILIFVVSSIPSLKTPDLGFNFQDKLAHAFEFGIFGFFLSRSTFRLWGNRIWVVILTVMVGLIYGGLDEIHQSFVPGREAAIDDFFADSLGVIIALIIFWRKKY